MTDNVEWEIPLENRPHQLADLRRDIELERECLDDLHGCGYPEDSFPCRIRHIQINTGAAKAAND